MASPDSTHFDIAEDVKAGLEGLVEQQFITSWRRDRSRWVIEAGATFGPFTTREAWGFVMGARAMGAAV